MASAGQVKDPARMVRLLWDPPPAGRSGLDVGRITTAAVELADEQGPTAVTMRAVAQRLDAGTMSLYTHVPGKPELAELMYDRVLGELYADGQLPRHHDDWAHAMRHVAARNWDLHVRHPWLHDFTPARPTLGPNLVAVYEEELAPLDGIGLTDAEMDLTLTSVKHHVASTFALQVRLDQARADGGGDWEWWARVERAVASVVDAERYPVGSRAGEAAATDLGGYGNPQRLLEFGTERLIAGVAAYVAGTG